MPWTKLNFGKHVGKTLPQVLFADPDWFFWSIEKGVFKSRPQIQAEAKDLDKKARNIKIPGDGDQVVEYVVHAPTRKFAQFDLVPRTRPRHVGSSPTLRGTVIDMSVPRKIAHYDKLGCRQLLRSLKHHVFGDERIRMTKARCEAFFDDLNNFEV